MRSLVTDSLILNKGVYFKYVHLLHIGTEVLRRYKQFCTFRLIYILGVEVSGVGILWVSFWFITCTQFCREVEVGGKEIFPNI